MSLMIIEKNGVKYFVFDNLSGHGVKHCFSTRVGGVSGGVYSSLNLGFDKGDDDANVKENYARLCGAVGLEASNIVTSHQTHDTRVEAVTQAGVKYEGVDGLMTDKTGIVLVTFYADCVPLLFYDPVKRVAANAHAGWKGVAADMAGRTVAAMTSHYGSDPNDILAGIGPCISTKNFEVEEDVVDIFKKQLSFCNKFIYNSESAPGKYYIDLRGICRLSLLESGLAAANIEATELCTYDNADLFYSHRRDGLPRGSLAALIGLG